MKKLSTKCTQTDLNRHWKSFPLANLEPFIIMGCKIIVFIDVFFSKIIVWWFSRRIPFWCKKLYWFQRYGTMVLEEACLKGHNSLSKHLNYWTYELLSCVKSHLPIHDRNSQTPCLITDKSNGKKYTFSVPLVCKFKWKRKSCCKTENCAENNDDLNVRQFLL